MSNWQDLGMLTDPREAPKTIPKRTVGCDCGKPGEPLLQGVCRKCYDRRRHANQRKGVADA